MAERFRYDTIVKEIFEKDRPSLLDRFTGGRKIRGPISGEFQKVVARAADLLLDLDDDTILHIDFQSENDLRMPVREGIYGLLIADKYPGRKLEQVVVYMGQAPMRMSPEFQIGGISVKYRLMDIREIEAADLLRSGRPGDYALALLARGGVARMREIAQRAARLPQAKRRRAFIQMAVLAGLRGASEELKMELSDMSVYVDIEKNAILRDLVERGKAEGKAEGMAAGMATLLRSQIETRFGKVPRWAEQRLRRATLADAEQWCRRVLTAPTLEAVLGPK